jgi:DNA adenine methylase
MIQKPFLKWIGGKTQILNDIISKFPQNINNYHEPFLGGGCVLLALLSQNRINVKGKLYAYDINKDLINVYKNIQNNKDELYDYFSSYMKEYDAITGDFINRLPLNIVEAKTSKESYYYWMRLKYNNIDKESVECSALFMFLNKTCFRGMYREGPKGFNVPYGHYKKTPNIMTKEELDFISNLIKDVEFICCDFNESIKNIKENDFVYLDPPYTQENKNSFVEYTTDGFNLETHKNLFNEIIKFNNKNIKFVLNNANTELVLNYFKKNYNCQYIVSKRAINPLYPDSTTVEMIISNC